MLLLCVPFLAIVPCQAQNTSEDALREEILSASVRIAEIDCDFVQTKQSSMMAQNIVSKGKMKYRKPDYLVWKYTEPANFAFIMDGQSLTVEKDGKSESLDNSRNAFFREIPKLIISNIDGSLFSSRMFRSEVSGTDTEIIAVLYPLNKDMKKFWSKFVLHYSLKSFLVSSFELYETGGDLTSISFVNCHYGFSE